MRVNVRERVSEKDTFDEDNEPTTPSRPINHLVENSAFATTAITISEVVKERSNVQKINPANE
jgi:hypothetical protein